MHIASTLSFWVASLVLVASAPVASSPRGAGSNLQLNEFLPGPARDWDNSGSFSSRDDEWVEVRNAGGESLDLAGFLLTDGDSIPRFAFSGRLEPGQRRVVFGREAVEWERENGFPAFGLSLGNTGDAVILWQVVGAETLLVDAYTYGRHEAAADRSVGRLNDDGDWVLFDGLNPYTGSTPPHGTRCDPTPGEPNLCVATTVGARTWGALKRIYR